MADKLWANNLHGALNTLADDFNSSLSTDIKMLRQDIEGSIAHATMLGIAGIISLEEAEEITSSLSAILKDYTEGVITPDFSAEDVHTLVEAELTRRCPVAGKRLHTARSRNDQVATDLRLYMRDELTEIKALLKDLASTLSDMGEKYYSTVMPGYTHLQRAQPVTMGFYMCAYGCMVLRDIWRVNDTIKRLNYSPLGAAALAGTTYPIIPEKSAELLGFDGICPNALDAVSDRDFACEAAFALSMVMTHLSRLCEELIMWSSWEFKFINISDAFSTGSSIMPQKKNPDIAELTRGKTGRVYGNLTALLTMLKGLPLAYNKDMQEDKDAIFDSLETVKLCLSVVTPMLQSITVNADKMRAAAAGGFINATDCADYLTAKGLPFRDAYRITGDIVSYCSNSSKTLEGLTLEEYKGFSPIFEEDIFTAVDLDTCVKKRQSPSGTAPERVLEQAALIKKGINAL